MDPIEKVININLEPEQLAFDVGANLGVYTKVMAARGAHVIAFEPDPRSTKALRESLWASSVEIVEAAVTDHDGLVEFYIDLRPGLHGLSSSVHQLRGMEDQTKKIVVPSITLDTFCVERKIRPHLIKIDVEGNESAVIRGARSVIMNCRPVILFEMWESWWKRGLEDTFEYLNPYYELRVTQTGELAYDHYKNRTDLAASNAVVDIVCTPRPPC